ncbi:MAG: DNA mismatch repair protein MutL [Wolbachia endosymbiont of Ctenocephalides orientis wCori]|nr:MAG: DNA mismatch repair protein MutL [Wolbachia endosymbiont of Ctenocephalides orientis wCori]
MIYTFVNKKPIKDSLLIGAMKYAYHDLIPANRYPLVVLHLEIPYDQVDVNVHPNKTEVRFQDKKRIYEIVTRGIIKALSAIIRGEKPVSDLLEEGLILKGEPVIDKKGTENEREFYEKRPSNFEGLLMKEFIAPASLTRESFSNSTAIVLEREQAENT